LVIVGIANHDDRNANRHFKCPGQDRSIIGGDQRANWSLEDPEDIEEQTARCIDESPESQDDQNPFVQVGVVIIDDTKDADCREDNRLDNVPDSPTFRTTFQHKIAPFLFAVEL
jgi:hypothetical protein